MDLTYEELEALIDKIAVGKSFLLIDDSFITLIYPDNAIKIKAKHIYDKNYAAALKSGLLPKKDLEVLLEDLTEKNYLRFEHPKKLVKKKSENGIVTFREYDETKPEGYNIVTGKLSFEINKILDPNDIAPTLVATDVSRLAVPDGKGLRRLTIREGLRLFGYPEWYEIPAKENEAFDLLGNTVAVPVVEFVAEKLAENFRKFLENTHPELHPKHLVSSD